MTSLIKEFLDNTSKAKDKEEFRFSWIFIILIIIAGISAIINYVTGYIFLFWVTLCFALLCILDYVLCKMSKTGVRLSTWLLAIELLSLFTFFIYTGMPEGTSIIWTCVLPACGLFLYKRKYGLTLIGLMFVILVFFLWTPWGIEMVKYDYPTALRIRFPFIYITFFLISLLLDTIRSHIFFELKKTKKEYEYLYYHDDLTGVYNRRGFNDYVNSKLQDESVSNVSLMVLDIDHFKNINDSYGHLVGDVILKELSDVLQENTKFPVARWGGEEFAIFVTDTSLSEKDVTKLCRIIESKVFDKKNKKIRLTVSAGVAYADRNVDPVALFRHADRCLYEAKNKGRNLARFCYINKESKK